MKYSLITTKNGLVPVEEIKEGQEVLCRGQWVKAPKPEKKKCFECSFETLPTTTFERKYAYCKQEVSICHSIILNQSDVLKPELSIRGYFKENKKIGTTTLIKGGGEEMRYWLPRFIRLYDGPVYFFFTAIGFNFVHSAKKFGLLQGDDLTERNLEYFLEGMNKRTFSRTNNKWYILPVSSWTETHRIVMRLLDIECDVHQNGYTVVRNPISFLRHIKDSETKSKIKDEEIDFELRRACELPMYTSGNKILKRKEVEDWCLPGINPDVNTISPGSVMEKGFTSMDVIRANLTSTDNRQYKAQKVENSFWEILQSSS